MAVHGSGSAQQSQHSSGNTWQCHCHNGSSASGSTWQSQHGSGSSGSGSTWQPQPQQWQCHNSSGSVTMAVAAGHSAYLAVTPRVRRPQHRVNLLRSQRQVAPAVALDAFGKLGAAGGGVAVAGWQWWQSTEEISAVRMVPVATW
jgi:hypothetical protein